MESSISGSTEDVFWELVRNGMTPELYGVSCGDHHGSNGYCSIVIAQEERRKSGAGRKG